MNSFSGVCIIQRQKLIAVSSDKGLALHDRSSVLSYRKLETYCLTVWFPHNLSDLCERVLALDPENFLSVQSEYLDVFLNRC